MLKLLLSADILFSQYRYSALYLTVSRSFEKNYKFLERVHINDNSVSETNKKNFGLEFERIDKREHILHY